MADDKTPRQIGFEAGEKSEKALIPPYRKSWALIVGISDYGHTHAPLPNARRDAEAFCELLRSVYSFDVVDTLYDDGATGGKILSWLRDKITHCTDNDDRVVFYFAGHGTTQKGPSGALRGFLVPVNAGYQHYGDYIAMEELHDACRYVKAKHVLIILDCCFSGVAAICSRGEPALAPATVDDAYLQGITSRKAWQVLTAGASDESVADQGTSPEHSPFTGVLLRGLQGEADENGDCLITATELASWVRPMVTRETSQPGLKGQYPFFNTLVGSEGGDFVFHLPGNRSSASDGQSYSPPENSPPPHRPKGLRLLVLLLLATFVIGYLGSLVIVGYFVCPKLHCGAFAPALAWLVAGSLWLIGGVTCLVWWRRHQAELRGKERAR